jgi:hypothetical protein
MRKINLIGIATAALSLVMVGAANADKILQYNAGVPNVIWDGGTLNLNNSGGTTVQPFLGQNGGVSLTGQSVTFTGLVGTSYSFTSPTNFDEELGNGTFSIGPGLLTGSFTGAKLEASSNTTGSVGFEGVSFTGGSWLDNKTVAPELTVTFGFNDPNVTWANFAGSDGLGAFNGIDTTDAFGFTPQTTSTPEPASVATFGIGAIALVLMAAVARRRNANAAL